MSDSATKPTEHAQEEVDQYEMNISRLTVDKLGVKLYDKVSAVVAELVANAYDADAEEVTIKLPLSSALATHTQDGVDEKGYEIEVVDDGHGMTPREAQEYYLEVGRNRREHEGQGARSRKKDRSVMGRKGIGKLAPFGVCREIEVLSAGGQKDADEYMVSHFYLDYEQILEDTNEPVKVRDGERDGELVKERGTEIRLRNFLPKRVPGEDTFHRQLASRFAFAQPDFEIVVEDIRNPEENPPQTVSRLDIPVHDNTEIDLSERPVELPSGKELPVDGWLAMAKNPYKNEEEAGVRIYARNKIVATTRDFEQPAGFTGEFAVRSYLVGEVFADWLDRDEGQDLIQSHRQDILWESEYGRAFRDWGSDLIREIGSRSRQPKRNRRKRKFIDEADLRKKAERRFEDDAVRNAAVELAEQIGEFTAEDELDDPVYLDDLSEVILSVAPHRALLDAFKDFRESREDGPSSIDDLNELFNRVSVAELASYSQIATERLKAIQELEDIIYDEKNERKLQNLIADAPWLINPTWSVISENQALKTFKRSFAEFWKDRHEEELEISIGKENKRPDFTLANIGNKLHVVEIKKAGHKFNDRDFERMKNYVYAFDDFFEQNDGFNQDFPKGWVIELIADGSNIKGRDNITLFSSFKEEEKVRRTAWKDFLRRARKAHERFLEASETIADGR